jgi:quercetin dioxygenase-like cupin family protein
MTTEHVKQELDSQALRVRQAVNKYKEAVRLDLGTGRYIDVRPDIWAEVPAANVHMIVCSLNANQENITVVNARFCKGGSIAPHSHDRYETVFVLSGTYRDPIRGVELGPGGVDRIDAGVLHSSQSDDALVTMTWRPAYPVMEVACDIS